MGGADDRLAVGPGAVAPEWARCESEPPALAPARPAGVEAAPQARRRRRDRGAKRLGAAARGAVPRGARVPPLNAPALRFSLPVLEERAGVV